MAKKTEQLNLTLVKRNAPFRGPSASDDWNDSIDEIINSFSLVANRINDSVVPLHALLPDGSDDVLVNAFKDGLDGRTLYIDASLTNLATDKTYYNSSKARPSTVKEALDSLYTYVDTQDASIQDSLAASVSPLTTAQKARVGMNIFDSTKTSDLASLDGLTATEALNIIQLAKDLYDSSSYALGGDGSADLTYSVKAMVNALLEAHGGEWNADIALVHSGITVNQIDISASAIYNDLFAGVPTNTQEDLNQVRTIIRRLLGTAGWTTALTPSYVGGPADLATLLGFTQGSGTKSATNPWGYYYTDIDELDVVITDIGTFVGQADPTDVTPPYSSTDIVTPGESLTDAISDLDEALGWAKTPGEMRAGEQFRRMEWGFSGVTKYCEHNAGYYPIVQLIMIDPAPSLSGEVPHYIEHIDHDSFNVVLTSGVVVSGVVLAQW
jgi:hypothetical protein